MHDRTNLIIVHMYEAHWTVLNMRFECGLIVYKNSFQYFSLLFELIKTTLLDWISTFLTIIWQLDNEKI